MPFGKRALDSALNEIDILRDVHLALVPLNPTEEMISAGCGVAGLSPMEARIVYEVMVRKSIPAPDVEADMEEEDFI